MSKKITTRLSSLTVAVTAALAGLTAPAISQAGETEWAGFVENATYVRDGRGITKFRNTGQAEWSRQLAPKGIFSEVSFHGTLRATYDGVYDLNEDEFGEGAGHSVMIESIGLPAMGGPGFVPHGGGLGHTAVAGAFGLTNNAFVDDYGSSNPNSGMIVLGEELHAQDGGVAFGVPARPCDVDSRGCLKGYLDQDTNDLRHPEFNDRWDVLREAYIDATADLESGSQLNFRIGRQQVVWGRTDLFRVLDVINPVDYSRNNIYDELEDIRIPMWILQSELRMGPTGIFDDLNWSVTWNFDKFRPSNLGSCSGAYNILDGACFFRGMKNLWDNGGTVANFAGNGTLATNFGPHQIGIRNVELPSWSLANTQLGTKLEGVYKDLTFSLNALTYRSQLPSLRGGTTIKDQIINPFTGELQNDGVPYLIAFDMVFPRVNLIGGSLDYYAEGIDTVIRLEGAYTQGEEFADTLSPDLYSESDVFRYVIGADKNVMIPALNKTRAFLISGQIFGEHLLDHRAEPATLGERGFAAWKSNNIATLLMKGWWMNDRLSPQVIMAHDFRANATAIAPSVEWLADDNWKVTLTANVKLGDGARKTDDCRSCNPYDPFTNYGTAEHAGGVAGSAGLSGFEPTGRFRSGPIGMAQKEDEIQLTVRYRF